jgi:AcrR family transcriptional regulator
VVAVGVRRTTLAEIARTAGASRMTLYRRFPDVRSILATLMTREFGAALRQASEQGAAEPTARGRLVRSAVAMIRLLAANPLMHTVLDVDADLVLPYIVDRLGTTQHLAEQAITALLVAGQRDGSIRRGLPDAQARTVLLVVQSFVFSLRPATSDVAETALLHELTHLLDAALRPAPCLSP